MTQSDDGAAAKAQQIYQQGFRALQENRLDDAAAALSQACLMAPLSPRALANLGVALRKQGKAEGAVAAYRRSLALDPKDAGVWSNMGNALRDMGRLQDAERAHWRAVKLAPHNASFLFNLALVLRDLRRLPEAMRLIEQALIITPGNPEFLWDHALTLLQMGEYRAGFEGYEARWGLDRSPPRKIAGRLWEGGDIAGKTLFLHAEQGFGDALQFARFVPLVVAEKGCRVVLECQPELMELFAGLPGVAAVVEKLKPPPAYDYYLPLLSLPRILHTNLANLPAMTPYLTPSRPPPVALPKGDKRLKVGLIWAGKTTPRDRSWRLARLMPLLGDPRIAFYSLQKGPRAGDIALCGAQGMILDAGAHCATFADSAAVMAELDLIISVDTATAHLAGALGRPVWVLLRYVSDWRWFDEPEDSPWYPTMRLFRQRHPEDWDGPIARMAGELAALAGAHNPK